MHSKKYKIVAIALLCIWMIVIFSFSAETAKESSATSGGVIRSIAKVVVSGFEKLSESQQSKIVSSFQGVVRSLAHLCIFAILGFLATNTAFAFDLKKRKWCYLPPLFCLLYAVTDEIHQIFIPGRAFQISDIAIDTLGGVLGTIAFWVVFRIVNTMINRRKSVKND